MIYSCNKEDFNMLKTITIYEKVITDKKIKFLSKLVENKKSSLIKTQSILSIQCFKDLIKFIFIFE